MKNFLTIFLLFGISTAFPQSFQWGKRGGSSDILNTQSGHRAEEAYSIATDSQKNIYLLSSVGTLNLNFDGHADTSYSDPISKTDKALVSFACDGTFRWSKIIGGGGFEEFQNVQVDSNDNVYIAGMFGDVSQIPYPQHIDDDVAFSASPIDHHRMVIIKYNSDGALQWYKRPEPDNIGNETYSNYARGLQIDSEGNLHWLVYVIPGSYADGGFIKPDDGQFWYVFKYNGNGNFISATPLAFQAIGATNDLHFYLNPYNGRYFLTARNVSSSGPNWATVGTENITHSTFIGCFDPTGQALWKIEDTSTSTGNLIFYNLVFDADNNIYLGGSLNGFNSDSFMGLTIPDFNIPSFLMKIDPTGTNALWTTRHNKAGNGYGALALNGQELAFTNFCAGNDFTWGSQTLNASSPNELQEVLFARFNKTTGDCLSLNKIPGNPGYTDYGCALAVDASGDYIIGGNFSGTLTFDGGAQITNVGGQSDFFIAKYATSACSPLAVQQSQLAPKLKLYPNPANTAIAIDVEEDTAYEIFSLQGRKVYSGMISKQSNSIDICDLQSGLYMINLKTGGDKQSIKFLKN